MENIITTLAYDLEYEKVIQAREQAKIQALGEFLLLIIAIELVVLLILIIRLAVQKFSSKHGA